MGDALFTSTIHLETYLNIADEIIERLLGESAEGLNDKQRKIREQILIGDPNDLSSGRASLAIKAFAKRAWRRPVERRRSAKACRDF